MAFNVKEHLINLNGKAYLPVAWRLVWFREEHPDWGIVTEPVHIDTEKGIAVFKATVYNAEGMAIGSGTKSETARGFVDFIEKAETGSIGRALAVCGFGTQFDPELDEGDRIVDSPQEPKQPQGAATPAGRPITEKQRGLIYKTAGIIGWDDDKLHAKLKEKYGVDSLNDLSSKQASETIEKLMAIEARQKEQ